MAMIGAGDHALGMTLDRTGSRDFCVRLIAWARYRPWHRDRRLQADLDTGDLDLEDRGERLRSRKPREAICVAAATPDKRVTLGLARYTDD